MSESFSALMRAGAARLHEAGVEGAARDCEILMRFAAKLSGAELSARLAETPEAGAAQAFEAAVEARLARIPVSHIIGGREFWGRWFTVTSDVLDPRPETEIIIAAALEGPAPRRILDLGAGSACLLATMLAERPAARGTGVDISAAALAVAQKNLNDLGLADRAELICGSWFEGVSGRFDLILCNPPYITEAAMESLAPEVTRHEPRGALTPGGDGLAPYRAIAPQLGDYLAPGGRAFFEFGAGQADAVAKIFAENGLMRQKTHSDFDNRVRCVEISAI